MSQNLSEKSLSNKIVVTGMGWATPFGCDLNSVFDQLYLGKTAVRKIEDVELDGIYCQIAAQMPKNEEYFPFEKWNKILPGNKASKFIVYGLEATERALLDAHLISESGCVDEKLKIGVIVGSGIGGLDEEYETSKLILEKGANRVSPYFVPSALINLLAGHIAIRHKIKGPNQSQVTACSTGAIAIADGARMIREGRCDIMVVGAAEATIGRLGMAGFCALRALAAGFNDDAAAGSRPFDKKRAGFVMGEGAGILILERYEHAVARGARIYCEYLDAGLSNDAYHITAPCADGLGAANAIKDALTRSGKTMNQIGYVNAHATSTGLGDIAEISAFKQVFGERWGQIAISSIKGAIGHMLGAAGSVEAIATILSLYHGKLLPTVNLEEPDEAVVHNGIMPNLVPNKGIQKAVDCVMSTSFGFGGHNIALVFQKLDK